MERTRRLRTSNYMRDMVSHRRRRYQASSRIHARNLPVFARPPARRN